MKKYSYPLSKLGWNQNTKQYAKMWQDKSKRWLSVKELNIIKNSLFSYLEGSKLTIDNILILDVGVGAGRILGLYIDECHATKVHGVDYAENMIKFNKQKYKNKVILNKCDISKSTPFKKKKFNFISAIRVIKYQKNWKKVFEKISSILKNDGIFVFSIPNKQSVNIFSGDKMASTTISELKNILSNSDLEILNTFGYTRLPEPLYNIKILQDLIIIIESILSQILPKHYLSKVMFVVVKKTSKK